MRRKLIRGVVLLLCLGLLAACADTETNEIGLEYSGGAVQDKAFVRLIQPGATAKGKGVGNKVYKYRTDQRSYIADEDPEKGDTGPVTVVSADDVQMLVEYQLYFTLNRDEKVLRKFHETIGVKGDGAYIHTGDDPDAGWVRMLRDYFEPQINRSLERAALASKWRDLYADENARRGFQDATVTLLGEAIKNVVGDQYFCGPGYTGPGSKCGTYTFTVGKPRPVNDDIVKAVESEQTAAAATVAQTQRNAEIAARVEGERKVVELYGPQWSVLRDAIAQGKVPQIILDTGGRVTVPNTPAR
jgi:SPFH domain / Band 7 family